MPNELSQTSPTLRLVAHVAPCRRPFARLFDRSTLPPDVMDEEITDILCFKASLALNRALGGPPDMTFSARTHAASHFHSGLAYYLWKLIETCVDAACRILRRESHHCETAWRNHCRRPRGKPGSDAG